MSPFFRGSVRPQRKHPRPWSLNPRLNPDIAKDDRDARASIYGVGRKEEITLPVHNGVYRDVAERTVGIEAPTVNAAPFVAETGKKEDLPVVNNSSPYAGSLRTAHAAETSGWKTEAIPEESEEGSQETLPTRTDKAETPLAAPDTVATKDVQPEVRDRETPVEQSREEPEEKALETAPAPLYFDVSETGNPATEALPVAESTINPGESSENPPLPAESNATPSEEIETAQAIEPHISEPIGAERIEENPSSATAELEPAEQNDLKEASDQSSRAAEVAPAAVEEPAGASPDAEVQPEEAPAPIEQAPASEAVTAAEAPVIQSEVPAQTIEAGAVPVEGTLTPPPENHRKFDEKAGGEGHEERAETDDESAAEAPFVPDHRHTPPSSRKASAQSDRTTTAAVADHINEVPPTEMVGSKSDEPTSVEGSIANEEPLMLDEQLEVSDEFRPGVKINPEAELAA